MNKRPITRTHLAICALLAVMVLSIYRQTLDFKFTNYDDQIYVTDNPHVQAGLTADSVRWALTTISGSNWHPLTWLSHMLDWQMYGNQPGLHHLTSVLIHILSAILLFLVLSRMTTPPQPSPERRGGSVWRSAFVAALFAVHPLHVESVAWVAERKDVLSTLFWILTMWAYTRYAESPSVKRYLSVLVFLALGLMAKPMLVTLPFALLLLDYWPLGRFRDNIWPLIIEKTPLVALAAASSVITYVAQQKGGAVAALQAIPFDQRISNAIVSYTTYLGRMFWPTQLTVFYPHPHEDLPVWQVWAALALLGAITTLVISQRRNRPYLIWGWLWYIGTLIPVIGLVQVGLQASADRYMYLPSIALFVAITWLVADLIPHKEESRREKRRRKSEPGATLFGTREISLATTSILIVLTLTVLARVQAGYWKDSIALFSHALAVTTDNGIAHSNLGIELAAEGRTDEATIHYQEALKVNPHDAFASNNLGLMMAGRKRYGEAIELYRAALKSRPTYPEAFDNLGNALAALGHIDEAITSYRRSIELDPNNPKAHSNLATALSSIGKRDEAIREDLEAVRLKPDLGEAHNNLAVDLYFARDYAGAWREVHLAQKYNAPVAPGFLAALAKKMPEPEGEP